MSWPQRNEPSESTTPSTMSPACVPTLIGLHEAPPSVHGQSPACASVSPKNANSAWRARSGIRPWPCRCPWNVNCTVQVAPPSSDFQSRIGVEAMVKTWYSRKYTAPSRAAKLCGVSARYLPVLSTSVQLAPRSVERASTCPDGSSRSASRVPSGRTVIDQKLPPFEEVPRLDQLRPSDV